MNRGSILHEDLTYTMLHEMVMKKFNLEANYPLNLSAKLSSIDDNFDITDDHEEALELAIRLKALDEGYQFLNDRSAPERTEKRMDGNTNKNRRKRSFRDVIHCPWCVDSYVRELSTTIAYNRCDTLKGSIQGNKSDSCRHGWKQPNCANCFWYMQRGNRHAAIALAVHNEFPLAYHAAYTIEDFSSSMSQLHDIQLDAYDKLCQVGPQRWKLPVLKLAETYHAMVQDWYYKRRQLAGLVPLADALQDRNMLLTYAQSHQNRLHVYVSRVEISPLVVADQHKDEGKKKEKHGKPSYMISYLTRKIPRRFTALYYTLPPNNTLSGLKQIKNDYDTNIMYDIAKVAGKIQLFVSHHQIDLSTLLIPNDGSLEEAFAGIISEATQNKLEESLTHLHQMQKQKYKKFDYYELLGDLGFINKTIPTTPYTQNNFNFVVHNNGQLVLDNTKDTTYINGGTMNINIPRMKLEELKQYLSNILGTNIHALYYKIPHNGFSITVKLRNNYDMHVMFDISSAHYKLQIYIDHLGVDFFIAKYIFPNASLAEMMNHVITNYTSDSEDNKREVTQNDYTFNQMVEWAEQEHFEDEETKLSCPKIDLTTVLKSNKGSSEKSFQSLSYLHQIEKQKKQSEETKAVQHQKLKKRINPENVRLNVLMKLQEALDEEALLEEQILTLMHHFVDRFTDRRVEINNLMVLQDHPLIDYGKYALGCMTGANMKKCVYLKSVRDELLRSMEEKRQLITNYRDM
ncbi:hypothetical protein Tco_0809390 [Tanacetum coccineum]